MADSDDTRQGTDPELYFTKQACIGMILLAPCAKLCVSSD